MKNTSGSWAVLAALMVMAAPGCGAMPEGNDAGTQTAPECKVRDGADLAPMAGILSGVNLDWVH